MDAISWDIWSTLIIIGLAQGLFVLSMLPFKLDWSKRYNSFLVGIIIVLVWLQFEFLSVRVPFNIPLNIFYGTRHGLWMLLGPLFYFYALYIYQPNRQLTIKDWFHFAPFFILTIVIPLLYTDILNFRQIHYGMLTVFDPFNDYISPLQYVYSSIFIIQFIHFTLYLISAKKVIGNYKSSLEQSYSSFDSSNLKWLSHLSFTLLAILLFASLFLAVLFYTRIYRRHIDYLYVLPMAYLMYLVSYKLANVSWKQLKTEEINKYAKSSLDSKTGEEYAKRLNEYIINNKPYLDNELRLAKLAEEIDIPSHHLSQVINEKYGLNFYDFINKFRVDETIAILEQSEKEKISLLEIAFKAGFNNKTSFTNSFKKFKGVTPSRFKSEQQK